MWMRGGKPVENPTAKKILGGSQAGSPPGPHVDARFALSFA
jgi:hypothetical protein